MKPHLHREAIIAWADGARIQSRYKDGPWIDCNHIPEWQFDHEYRAKPTPDYPTTRMSGNELYAEFKSGAVAGLHLTAVANAALRHACDAGQVVPREEFDRALADREARDAAIASAALCEAALLIESMGLGLMEELTGTLSDIAKAVRETSIFAIVNRTES